MGKLNCCGAIVNQVYLEGKSPKPLEAPKGSTIRRPKVLLSNKLFKDFFPTENEPWYDGRKHLLHLGTDSCAKHCEKMYPGWMDASGQACKAFYKLKLGRKARRDAKRQMNQEMADHMSEVAYDQVTILDDLYETHFSMDEFYVEEEEELPQELDYLDNPYLNDAEDHYLNMALGRKCFCSECVAIREAFEQKPQIWF